MKIKIQILKTEFTLRKLNSTKYFAAQQIISKDHLNYLRNYNK